jgi:Flp pilus assembly protein TadG
MSRKRFHKQHGGTLVEAAFTIVILLLFLMAILEFGRAYNIYHIITDAAREGARFGVTPQQGTNNLPTATQIQTVVNEFLASGGVTGAAITVTYPTETINGVQLQYTAVTVNAPYNFIVPQLLFGAGTNITSVNMQTEASMRDETN